MEAEPAAESQLGEAGVTFPSSPKVLSSRQETKRLFDNVWDLKPMQIENKITSVKERKLVTSLGCVQWVTCRFILQLPLVLIELHLLK